MSAPAIKVSSHAVDRYRKRIKPNLSPGNAAAELEVLIAQAPPPTTERPDYCPPPPEGIEASLFLEPSDGICLPLAYQESGGYLLAVTVLTRAALSDAARARRNEKQATKRRRRAERRKKAARRSDRPHPWQRDA